MEVAVLEWLVGRRLRIYPTGLLPLRGARPQAPSGPRPGDEAALHAAGVEPTEEAAADGSVVAVVVHREGSALRLASGDEGFADFDGHEVVGQAGTGAELVRVTGTIAVHVADRLPVVATLLALRVPEAIQRREWVRVPAPMPVRYRQEAPGRRGQPSAAIALDLSGGGTRVSGMSRLPPGARVVLELDLGSGPVDVDGEVVGVLPDGTTRLRFVQVPEAVSRRIVRHVFSLQISRRRLLPPGPRP